ncbi:MAG TPA: NIPSNAP family protein [Desulfobacteria bacterium]|nr:NIPSNAP family protein [Desulfobacteria bacterium]
MVFEMRQYRIKDGKRDQWVKLMEEQIIPFQTSKGVVVVGSFVAREEDDLYVWIRRFESEADRKRLYKEVYESDFWINEIKPQSEPLLDRESIINTLLEATPKSVLQ